MAHRPDAPAIRPAAERPGFGSRHRSAGARLETIRNREDSRQPPIQSFAQIGRTRHFGEKRRVLGTDEDRRPRGPTATPRWTETSGARRRPRWRHGSTFCKTESSMLNFLHFPCWAAIILGAAIGVIAIALSELGIIGGAR